MELPPLLLVWQRISTLTMATPTYLLELLFTALLNSIQTKHTILRNSPILGYFRYPLETIAPEIQKYFIERNTDGKPIGFKLYIGQTNEFELICQEMILQNCFLDFITVDGAESGIGAAPLLFSDAVGMPFEPALIFVNKTLISLNIRDKIRVICSGKII